ncbi:hypothetical protein P3T76_002496 [Phytophthora citrophthora]|uniref:Uncharacterized protein n=1 Tax=Phytophthora citrophthora TaxID=4793 RepID=A0AAD9GWG0_9STRA|nr:hypothetical protein P3T76_002496 [Phytophthora citrophthora]
MQLTLAEILGVHCPLLDNAVPSLWIPSNISSRRNALEVKALAPDISWGFVPVFQKFLPCLLCERNATIASSRLQANRYSAVVRIVTIWVLNATDKLCKEAANIVYQRRERTRCSGSFRVTHDRPCIHELIRVIELNEELKLKPCDFESHWWVQRDLYPQDVTRIEEHAVIRTTRRKPKSRNHRAIQGSSGTAQDPIFE